MAVTDGRISWIGRAADWSDSADREYDCRGSAVVPALVDPHTHAVWAGDRLSDFEARVSGVSYEQILTGGGGIRSTIRQTAALTPEDLAALAKPRIDALVRSGATTIEVKSGYGFAFDAELRMLEAIQLLRSKTPARLVSTLLIHIPPVEAAERRDYRLGVTEELIPAVVARNLASAIDVFVEQEAWSAPEAADMIWRAREYGLAAKLHTDQFHSIGGAELGFGFEMLSVDHLEVYIPFRQFTDSPTVATILPGVTLHLGIPPAPGRLLIDHDAAVAIGTDLNPGSSPLYSTQAALALAVRLNGLTPAEALTAGTANAAAALGLTDCGRLAPGLRADFLILDSPDWRDLPYTLGVNPIREVWINGGRAV